MSSIASGVSSGGGGGGRTMLAGNTTYNVSTAGSDTTGDGSVGNPWATPAHASAFISQNIDFNGFDITINMANGSYVGFSVGTHVSSLNSLNAIANNVFGAANLIFAGNPADYTAVTIGIFPESVGSCIVQETYNPVIVIIKNMTIDCRSLPDGSAIVVGCGIFAIGDGDGLGTVRFLGDPTHVHHSGEPFNSNTEAIIILNDTVLIDGGLWDNIIRCGQNGGHVQLGNSLVGGSNALTISFANSPQGVTFTEIIDFGTVTAPGGSVTIGAGCGAFNGSFLISPTGDINVSNISGAGLNFFPGTGTTSLGGNYIWSDGVQRRAYPGFFLDITKAGLPANTDLVAGSFGLFKDTSGGGVYLTYNDAGTIKKVALT